MSRLLDKLYDEYDEVMEEIAVLRNRQRKALDAKTDQAYEKEIRVLQEAAHEIAVDIREAEAEEIVLNIEDNRYNYKDEFDN